MQLTEFRKVIFFILKKPLLYTREFIVVGLLGENYHQIYLIVGERLLLSEDVVSLL